VAYRAGATLGLAGAAGFALDEPAPAATDATDQAALTKRERQVADLVARGLTNREIATELVLSARTAQGHVQNILVKLGFTSRAQIAAWVASLRE
jgi:DNA-binding NarL/FixJ family response regulator